MKYVARLALTLALVLCATPSCSGKGTTDRTSSCPVGSEKCPCSEDGSCDSGLQCLSQLCVALSAGGSSNGGGVSTGGMSAGGMSAGGKLGKGGTGGLAPTGGSDSAGGDGAGTASCSDTMTDWQNCSSCGHACANRGIGCGANCCVAGKCADTTSRTPCFAETDNIPNCDVACQYVAEMCVPKGCSGSTWQGWAQVEQCNASDTPDSSGSDACSKVFTWDASSAQRRWCCTDTRQ